MSRSEAVVLIAQLKQVTEHLHDIRDDVPLHVAMDYVRNIHALEDAQRELARLHGLTV